MLELFGRGIWERALRLTVGATAVLVSVSLWPGPPPPAGETRVDVNRSTRLLLAIDLVVLAAKDCVKGRDPALAVREFDLGLRQVQELVVDLERDDPTLRLSAHAVESEMVGIETVVRAATGGLGAGRVEEIARRRDRIAAMMTDLHLADLRRHERRTDGPPVRPPKLGGAGLATL